MRQLQEYIREKWVDDFTWAYFDNVSVSAKLNKPLSECKVALVSSSGVYLKDSQEAFKENGGKGDHSFRTLPYPLDLSTIAIAHEHYNHKNADKDINCVLPIDALAELVKEGKLGSVSERIYTIMGYIPIWEPLLKESAPIIAEEIKKDNPDVVLYAPV